MTPHSKRIAAGLGLTLTVVFLVYLFATVDFERAMCFYSRLSVGDLALATGLYFLSVVFRSLRFALLLGRVGERPAKTFRLLPMVLIHNMYNRLLPLRAGELTYLYFLKTLHRYPLDAGVSSLLLSRLYDAFCVLTLSLGGALWLLHGTHEGVVWALALCWLGLLAAIWRLPEVLGLGARLLLALSGVSASGWARRASEAAWRIGGQVRPFKSPGLVAVLLLSSLAVWLCIFGMFHVMTAGFGMLDLSFASFLKVAVASTLALFLYVLPINSVSGPMELGWTAGFVALGFDRETALLSGFAVNLCQHAGAILFAVGGALAIAVERRTHARRSP